MSPDTVVAFFTKYGNLAKSVCPEAPEHIHPHKMRYIRAIHLCQPEMPLALLSQYLGHTHETTMTYSHAGIEINQAAIQKADAIFCYSEVLQVKPFATGPSSITSE